MTSKASSSPESESRRQSSRLLLLNHDRALCKLLQEDHHRRKGGGGGKKKKPSKSVVIHETAKATKRGRPKKSCGADSTATQPLTPPSDNNSDRPSHAGSSSAGSNCSTASPTKNKPDSYSINGENDDDDDSTRRSKEKNDLVPVLEEEVEVEEHTKNSKITDYFQVRKSSRRCKSELDLERHRDIERFLRRCIRATDDESLGLQVRLVAGKGRAVFATRRFRRGEFVCEYAGELVSAREARERELTYTLNSSVGCYMYFFEYKSKNWCIDATAESGRLGRLLNHSKCDANCRTKLFVEERTDRPHLILVAARDIERGEELTYDYGDRNRTSIECHPWLAV